MKKTIWTLNIGDYAPQITEITFPLMRHYARKIDADFRVITNRKFEGYPIPYEKLQIYELGREYDWNLFFDADTLINPETIDFTEHLSKDTVVHNGVDNALVRWRQDDYFRRDSRHIGSCNWCTFGSDWCLDLWHPLDDLSLEEAVSNIFPTMTEFDSKVIDPEHLLDDYTLSRNIAKYGLKLITIPKIWEAAGLAGSATFHHTYTDTLPAKIELFRKIITLPRGNQNCGWGLGEFMTTIMPSVPQWLEDALSKKETNNEALVETNHN